MQVLTSDQKLYTLKNFHIQYSKLFTDLESTIIDAPVHLLVKSDIFDIILDFMNIEQNVYSLDSKINVTQRERNFFTKYGIDTVIDVCSAANYLCYYLLLEVSANVVAEYFKSKDMEELNSLFGNEMNENEKRNIAKDFDWIPDKNDL